MVAGADALFEERLDVFMEKSMNEIREFALRERRNFDEVCLNLLVLYIDTIAHFNYVDSRTCR